ncbi:hypothetical protein PoB_001473100 [Plakobranchus ocellatus]|uniref:Transmembrane protein n=1 Tax=Plakobranchus ocellatus TaxID=259542 RepID=A0AAV3Z0X5_9GAST|nr:hypothetical protein PoB_001473100 [Plakobranchus ocellatus]
MSAMAPETSDEESTEMSAMAPETRSVTSESSSIGEFTAADERQISWNYSTRGLRQFVKSPKGMVITAVVVTIIVVFLTLKLAKIVTGAIHIGSCSLDPFVPIYLVSSGILFLIFLVILILVCVKCRHQGFSEGDDRVSPLHLLVLFYFFIHIVLQLAGSVCVIRAREDLQDQAGANMSAPVTESSVFIESKNVQLDRPEVTPPDPLMEIKVRIAPVITHPSKPLLQCSAELLDFAFAAVIFELIVSGLFFIFILASLYELAIIVRSEQSVDVKKTMTKGYKSQKLRA